MINATKVPSPGSTVGDHQPLPATHKAAAAMYGRFQKRISRSGAIGAFSRSASRHVGEVGAQDGIRIPFSGCELVNVYSTLRVRAAKERSSNAGATPSHQPRRLL